MFEKKIGFFFLLTGLIISCSEQKEKSSNTPPPPVSVDILVAASVPVHYSVEANGTVLSEESADIHPEISGRLTFLQIPDGAKVSAGTVLAKINDKELQAQLAKVSAQLKLAEKTEDRLKKLLSIQAIQQAEYDIALGNLESLQAEKQLLEAQLEKTIVKAPFSGTLGLRNISPGAYVTPSTVITSIQQTDLLKIDFTIPDTYLKLVKKGQQVVFFGDDSSKGTAVVTALEPQSDLSTRNIKVRATTRDKSAYPGSFVKVNLSSAAGLEGIFVPSNALIPDASSSKLIVMKKGKAEMVKVTTGYRTATGVEITSGITAGDSIVVKGVLFVKKGATLKVKSVKAPKELMNDL